MSRAGANDDNENPDENSRIESFRQNARLCVEYICEVTKRIPKKPVYPSIQPGYLRSLLPSKCIFKLFNISYF